MKKAIIILALGIALCTNAFAEGRSVIVGRIDLIEKDYIRIDNKQYKLINDFSEDKIKIKYGFETEYWVWIFADNGKLVKSYQVNFRTLAGVGYIDKARVFIDKGIVRKIEVLDLQQ